MKFSLSDLANRQLELKAASQDPLRRIKWRIRQLMQVQAALSNWEQDFILSIHVQLTQGKKVFSDPQLNKVLTIWRECAKLGWVELPKGEL